MRELGLTDPRLVARVLRATERLVWESGIRAKAQADLRQVATTLVEELPALVRDQFGFTTRSAQREQLIAPYLQHVPVSRREWLQREMVHVELGVFGREREQRYATAARLLMAADKSKTGTARILGISTSVIDRICGPTVRTSF